MTIDPMADYRRLQRWSLLMSLVLAAIAVLITAVWFSGTTVLSVAVGCIAGMLYLLLLTRAVEKLGSQSRQVGKAQLLVPVVLVLLSTRWPLLELLPALIGFLIYKPAVIITTALDLRSNSKPSNA
jgi:ATP synthase protein I|tara:strand:- start:156 stop:533 length:378 start_codon:yes stop_codon:yes gene_type:complete